MAATKTSKINASTQDRIDAYRAEAEFFLNGSKAKVVAELKAKGYAPSEYDTEEKLAEVRKNERTAALHRARAVKSSAVRRASRAA